MKIIGKCLLKMNSLVFVFILCSIINICFSDENNLNRFQRNSLGDSMITHMITETGLIFSTRELKQVEVLSPDEYPLKVIGRNNVPRENKEYSIIRLPDHSGFSVVITVYAGGDNYIYLIYVVKSGTFILREGLDVSPFWEEPCDDGDYRQKYFEIYSDYTIRIDTEERLEGEINNFTKYYRINKDGEFYQLDESEL